MVDDASTDNTPDVVQAKARQYPGNVVHLRRDKGGEGKAHTLNHGLAIILEDEWMEALLIMDADVIYAPDSMRKMARHLSDPKVSAPSPPISKKAVPGHDVTQFIASSTSRLKRPRVVPKMSAVFWRVWPAAPNCIAART